MGIIRLYEICPEAEKAGIENAVVTGVTDNTAEVKQGSIFVCVKGARFDGHSAAAEMLSKGAVMIVTDHDIKCGKQLVTDNTRLYLARLLNSFTVSLRRSSDCLRSRERTARPLRRIL